MTAGGKAKMLFDARGFKRVPQSIWSVLGGSPGMYSENFTVRIRGMQNLIGRK